MLVRLAVLTVALFTLAAAPRAQAGTYDVYSCRLPDGSPAPTYGWVPFNYNGEVADTCASGGSMAAALRWEIIRVGDEAGWTLLAPADTQIVGFTVYRWADAGSDPTGGSRDYFVSYNDLSPLSLLGIHSTPGREYCMTKFMACRGFGTTAPPLSSGNRLEMTGVPISRLTFQVRCWDWTGGSNLMCTKENSSRGALKLFQTRVRLSDDVAPEIIALSDQVFAGLTQPLVGSVAVAIDATDRGAGLVDAVPIVDGVEGTPVTVVSRSCRPPYVEFRPCPRQDTLTVNIDTSALANGAHQVQFAVRDAGGNETRTGLQSVTVANPGPPLFGAEVLARLKAWFSGGKSSKGKRTLRYGRSTTVAGTLTYPDGRPVAHAPLEVEEQLVGRATRRRPPVALRTDDQGRFSYRLAAGASRVVQFAYRPPGVSVPVTTARVAVRVHARVKLRTSRKRVRNGTRLRFFGRVLGERGTRRALVTIYAVSGGPRRRIPVETVRAASDGRFSYTYRFRSIVGPSVYRFQARVPKQTGFPYLAGASRHVTVRGRP